MKKLLLFLILPLFLMLPWHSHRAGRAMFDVPPGASLSENHDSIYDLYADSIDMMLKSNKPHIALSIAGKMYEESEKADDNYGRYRAYIALADIYQERGDTLQVIENINKALEYCSKNGNKPTLTQLYTTLYQHKFPFVKVFDPSADRLLKQAFDVAQNRADTFVSTLFAAYQNARRRDTASYFAILPYIDRYATPALKHEYDNIYHRVLSYEALFRNDIAACMAERKKILNPAERYEAVYNIARYAPPYSPHLALVYADSLNMQYVSILLRSNNALLLQFNSVINNRKLAAEAEQKEMDYQAAAIAEGKAQIERERLQQVAQRQQIEKMRLEQERQAYKTQLYLTNANLRKRLLEIRHQQNIRHNQSLAAEQKRNGERQVLLGIGIIIALILLSIATFRAQVLRKRARHINSIREKEAQLRDTAIQASKDKDAFIRSMSYEVRTPLNNVSGFAQLLAQPKDALSDEEREEYGMLIQNDSLKLTKYIDRLLKSPQDISINDIETTDIKDEEESLRRRLREMNLLRILVPLVMLCLLPMLSSRQYAAIDPVQQHRLDHIDSLISSDLTLEALSLTRQLNHEAHKAKDIELRYRIYPIFVRLFTQRNDIAAATPNILKAIEINSMRRQPANPAMLFCSLFDYTSSYNGRDTLLATYLDSVLHYAATPGEKAEAYLRLTAYHGIRCDTAMFKSYLSLYQSACQDTLNGNSLMPPLVTPTHTRKIETLVSAMGSLFDGDVEQARRAINETRDKQTRCALHYLMTRLNHNYWRALNYRDSIMTLNRQKSRDIDSLDRIWIERYLGNDSLRQAIVRHQKETNATLIRQQRLDIERHRLEARNAAHEAEKQRLELSNRARMQQLRVNKAKLEQSRLEIKRQKLAIHNETLKNRRNEAVFAIRVMGITICALVICTGIIITLILKNRKEARELMNITRELHNASVEAMHAMKMKNQFIQNMSHEIRTPLNAITGFSQLLSLPADTFDDDERHEFATYIDNNIRLLAMLLDDIINIGDIEKGEYNLKLRTCAVNQQARMAMAAVKYRVPAAIDMLFCSALPDNYKVRTDSKRIQQVLINFLTNAIKHTAAGSITVSVKRVCDSGGNATIQYSVSDTGTGIPAEEAEKIFERFVKLNDFVQGTGLGLNICHNIATKLGGRVWLDTAYPGNTEGVEHGARFVLAIPDRS